MESLIIILLVIVAYLATRKCDVCGKKEGFFQTAPAPATDKFNPPVSEEHKNRSAGEKVAIVMGIFIAIIFGLLFLLFAVPTLVDHFSKNSLKRRLY